MLRCIDWALVQIGDMHLWALVKLCELFGSWLEIVPYSRKPEITTIDDAESAPRPSAENTMIADANKSIPRNIRIVLN